ncbi:MAG TPA: transglycosylase SLT domain-containing protein [Verrucomicrobiae bacterium]|nr:transglycosylase SLT domain-containing protein [Verrucomicrobiae bacterium]
MPATPDLLSLARAAASKHSLDPALVCAVVEQESAWDTHAIRYEPAFRTRYVAPLGLPSTEEVARSVSWGLMQVMGQVAREHGFTGKFLSALCEPAAGLDIGCAVLASKLAAAGAQFASSRAAVSSVEARDFSPAKNAGRATPSLLPQAAAETQASEQQGSSSAQSGQGVALDERVVSRALQLWNGGANPDYAAEVLARLPHYK